VAAISGRGGSAALEAARLLSERLGVGGTVLSVLEPEPALVMGPDVQPIPPDFEEMRALERRASVARQIGEVFGASPAWPFEVLYGEPARTIAKTARERHAPLIVMGIGRHDRTARLLAAEVALRTVRHADRPVLAVAGELRTLPRVAVAAVDFSPSSIAAVQAALTLLADGATLYLVHAWWCFDVDVPALRARDEAYERSLPALFERLESALRISRSVTLKRVSLPGEVPDELLSFANAKGAELLVAGRQGHGVIERLLVGSVTTALLRGATCSVLVGPVPSIADTDRLQRHVSGTFEGRAPEEWAVQLDGFTRRNYGRPTALEVDDPRIGAQSQETGYALIGATYDPHDRRVELMLGEQAGAVKHLTRTIADVSSVAVLSDARDRDVALRIAHGDGQTVLKFLDDGE
jgi:nucleotide-binding universal stress UspA family protein